jgi:Ni,Fe-hydrogenase III large subunit
MSLQKKTDSIPTLAEKFKTPVRFNQMGNKMKIIFRAESPTDAKAHSNRTSLKNRIFRGPVKKPTTTNWRDALAYVSVYGKIPR